MSSMNREEIDRFDSEDFERAYHSTEPLGAFLLDGETRFALWAPTAQAVTLRLYAQGSGGRPFACHDLTRGERGIWRCAVAGRLDGVYYDYEVSMDGVRRRAADPYARACGLNGARSMVIDLRRTDPPGWAQDSAPARESEDIIYEIHIKDFSSDPASGVSAPNRGKYRALCEAETTLDGDGVHPTCLAHLRRLGVTHVELMPVFDFGSVDEGGSPEEYNWGYDPVNYNVPEGSYASDPAHGETRIRELKEAILSLHQNGLRVIMDVVYNHTYTLDSCLFATAPWAHYRRRADGSAGNGSGCGSEIASERAMTARYILDSVLYWAEEYHMDGFRFDLMGLLDVPLMNRIRRELDARYGEGEKLVFGEPWAGGEPNARRGVPLCSKGSMRLLSPGVGAFCDDTRDAIRGGLYDARSPGFASHGPFSAEQMARCIRGWAGEGLPMDAPSQTITYISSHDDWTLFDKLVYALCSRRVFERGSPEVLRANRLAAAMLFCCQGHLFLLSGEEFARTKRGIRNTYASGAALNRLDWHRAAKNAPLCEYYRGLIALRKQLPALCDKSPSAGDRLCAVSQPREDTGLFLLDNTGGDSAYGALLLAFHTGREGTRISLPEGDWAVLADGRSSFLWEHPALVSGSATLDASSALILGRREAPERTIGKG